MDTRTLNGHVNAARELLRTRGLTAGDAATVAQWVVFACALDLLGNEFRDIHQRFVMLNAETALKEAVRAGFRLDRRIQLSGH